MQNKLAVFDLDSTLLDGESINVVLEAILTDSDQKRDLEAIRAKGMSGELDLETSLKQRIAFLEGLSLNKLNQICQEISWTQGAQETIRKLKEEGYLTVCLSGGFRTICRRVITELGMDAYCCNTLGHENNVLTGTISGQLMNHQRKGHVLANIQRELGIRPENTLVVGDGANDLSMFKLAGISVAFCAHESLLSEATQVITNKDLSEVLLFL